MFSELLQDSDTQKSYSCDRADMHVQVCCLPQEVMEARPLQVEPLCRVYMLASAHARLCRCFRVLVACPSASRSTYDFKPIFGKLCACVRVHSPSRDHQDHAPGPLSMPKRKRDDVEGFTIRCPRHINAFICDLRDGGQQECPHTDADADAN